MLKSPSSDQLLGLELHSAGQSFKAQQLKFDRVRAALAEKEAGIKRVFAEKKLSTAKPVAADFVGVELPDRYVFGYGLDVNGAWRNLPAIYGVKRD